MAVHTPLELPEIAAFLDEAGLQPDRLDLATGVAEGSIHTTYRLQHAGQTRYLRRYEGSAVEDIEHELALIGHLQPRLGDRLRLPGVIAHADGRVWRPLKGAPAVLFEAVPGAPLDPSGLDLAALREVGQVASALHRASEGFEIRRENAYGPATVRAWYEALRDTSMKPGGDPEVRAALPRLGRALALGRGAVTLDSEESGADRVVCHADLFPDNLHWSEARIVGVLDLEMACDLPREWDLAVGLLVFCWAPEGPVAERAGAFLDGYREAWPDLVLNSDRLGGALHFVAARYALSRIRDFAGSGLTADRLVRKDWRDFDRRLEDLERVGPEFWRAVVAR